MGTQIDFLMNKFYQRLVSPIAIDTDINAIELNRRFSIMNANFTNLSTAFFNASLTNPSFYETFMKQFSEIAFYKSMDVTNKAAFTYDVLLDTNGNALPFAEGGIVFPINEFGNIDNARYEILVFVKGRLLKSSDFLKRELSGGVNIYIRGSLVNSGDSVAAIVLKTPNRLRNGNTGDCIVENLTVVLSNGIPCIVLEDTLRYGIAFDIAENLLLLNSDSTPIAKTSYTVEPTQTPNRFLVKFIGTALVAGNTVFAGNNTTYYSFEQDLVTTSITTDYVFPVINGAVPVMASSADDFQVWVDGFRLVPNDTFAYTVSASLTPRITIPTLPIGNHTIRIVKNMPFNAFNYGTYTRAMVGTDSAKGIYDTPNAAALPIRMVDNLGVVYTNGQLVTANTGISIIGDDIGIHFKELRNTSNFFFDVRFVSSKPLTDVLVALKNEKSSFRKLYEVTGFAITPAVMKANYITTAGIVAVALPNIDDSPFPSIRRQ